uniref:Uncharacterized protein n=1 Tax=Lepeophtheirus salmonis TaxID=72036 RepID=A0A0K2SXH3_LEPSM
MLLIRSNVAGHYHLISFCSKSLRWIYFQTFFLLVYLLSNFMILTFILLLIIS